MENKNKAILSLKDVEVKFNVRGRILTAIRGVSMDIYENESIAIVGESGSGKSVLTKTFAGMLDSNGFISKGDIILSDDELSKTTVKLTPSVVKKIGLIKEKLNSYVGYVNGAEKYLEIKSLKDNHLSLIELTEDEIDFNEKRIIELTNNLNEAFNNKQTIDKQLISEKNKSRMLLKKENEQIKAEFANDNDSTHENQEVLQAKEHYLKAISDLKEEKATVDKNYKIAKLELNEATKEIQSQTKKKKKKVLSDKEYMTNYKAKLEQLTAEWKEACESSKVEQDPSINERIANEIYLSVGRYNYLSRMSNIRKLQKEFMIAYKMGRDLSNPEVLNDVFDKVVFRVEYLSTDKVVENIQAKEKLDIEAKLDSYVHYLKGGKVYSKLVEKQKENNDANKAEITKLKIAWKNACSIDSSNYDPSINDYISREIYLKATNYSDESRKANIKKLLTIFKEAYMEGKDLSDHKLVADLIGDCANDESLVVDTPQEIEILNGYALLNLAKFKLARDWQQIRGCRIATVFQDPMTSLNPIITIGKQIVTVIKKHQHCSDSVARARAIDMMTKVGIPDAAKRFNDYPFQYSGGMRQRIVIAIALSCQPKILICDEPTTALDVTIQAQIIDLIKNLQKELNFTTIYITHDLGVVAAVADRVAILYSGQVVEYGNVDEIFYDPRHPYTWALLSSLSQLSVKGQKLYSISGTPPSLYNKIIGDPFAPRNPYCLAIDLVKEPPYFPITDTHYAKTWLLDPRAPKVTKPEIIQDIHEKLIKNVEGIGKGIRE